MMLLCYAAGLLIKHHLTDCRIPKYNFDRKQNTPTTTTTKKLQYTEITMI